MNRTYNFINFFVLRGKDGTIVHWRISSFVILALVVALLALGVYATLSVGENVATVMEVPTLRENPELKVVQRYAEWPVTQVNPLAADELAANMLAVNPELKYAQRYAASAEKRMQTLFGDTNPELNVHQRFMNASAQADALAFQYASPEVRIHRHLVELGQENLPAAFLAENPELKVVRRFGELNK